RLDDHLHPLGSVARSGQSIPSTAPPDPSRSGTIPYGSACACRRTRRRRRSSASWKNSAGGIGVFHQIREVFFRPSLEAERLKIQPDAGDEAIELTADIELAARWHRPMAQSAPQGSDTTLRGLSRYKPAP